MTRFRNKSGIPGTILPLHSSTVIYLLYTHHLFLGLVELYFRQDKKKGMCMKREVRCVEPSNNETMPKAIDKYTNRC